MDVMTHGACLHCIVPQVQCLHSVQYTVKSPITMQTDNEYQHIIIRGIYKCPQIEWPKVVVNCSIIALHLHLIELRILYGNSLDLTVCESFAVIALKLNHNSIFQGTVFFVIGNSCLKWLFLDEWILSFTMYVVWQRLNGTQIDCMFSCQTFNKLLFSSFLNTRMGIFFTALEISVRL